jgi:hypothetical protein
VTCLDVNLGYDPSYGLIAAWVGPGPAFYPTYSSILSQLSG